MKTQIPLLFLLSLIILFSCEPEVANRERVYVNGKIIDTNGSPLSNIKITSHLNNYLLGESITDGNGEFEYTSLQATSGTYAVKINNEAENKYSSIIYNYEGFNFESSYSFSDLILREKAILNFQIVKTSSSNDILTANIQYSQPFCENYFSEDETLVENCYDTVSDTFELNSSNPEALYEIVSLKNSEVLFTYQINQDPEETITIPLTEETNSYVFEY